MKTLCLMLICSMVLGLGVPSIGSDSDYEVHSGGAKPIENGLDMGLMTAIPPNELWKMYVIMIVAGIACAEANK